MAKEKAEVAEYEAPYLSDLGSLADLTKAGLNDLGLVISLSVLI